MSHSHPRTNPCIELLRICAPLVLGSAILAFGLFQIHGRYDITEGGVLGVILLIDHWFHIPPSLAGPVLDILCYLLALRLLGRGFLARAIFSSLSFAVFYAVFSYIGFVLPDLSALPLVAAILGSCFVGIGIGIIVRAGGACGGDDALVLMLARTTGRPISHCYFFTDAVVLFFSLSYIPPQHIVYSLVTVSISSFIIQRVVDFKPTAQ